MNTVVEAPSAPVVEKKPAANLSVRQLGALLSKPADAAGKESGAHAVKGQKAAAKGASVRETVSAEPEVSGAEPEVAEGLSLSRAAGDGEGASEDPGLSTADEGSGGVQTEPGAVASDSEGQTEPEPVVPEGGEPEGETEAEVNGEPTRGELAPEILEAIAIAKAQDGGKGKADLLKRVHKLVDQRDTERLGRLRVEEEKQRLVADLEEARKGGQNATAVNGAAVHPEVARLAGELANAKNVLAWLDEHPDGGELPDGKGGTIEFEGAKVRSMRRDMEDLRSQLVAQKTQVESQVTAQREQAYRQIHGEALNKFPWLKDANSAESQEMQTILRALPALKAFPDHEMVLGYYFKGRAAEQAAAAAKGKAVAPVSRKVVSREPTRVVAEAPSGRAARPEPVKVAASQADEQFRKTGSVKDLAKRFAAHARASRV